MAEHEHHHHHRHRKDSATIFKERSLQAIANRKVIEKAIKTVLVVLAVLMAIAVVVVYKFL
jgi:cell division protein FtsL